MDDEQSCQNCFWFAKRYEIFGRCRNPRNASIGSAGSDYSSSELLKPMDTKMNMVCDLHEEPATPNLRMVYEVKPVQRAGAKGFAGYAGYTTEWVRVE